MATAQRHISKIRKWGVEIISYLFIMLFVYAAVSKLVNFEQFQVQISQSPLLGAFASWIPWFIPALEILVSLLLIFPRYRLFALYAAYSIMVMFTSYIIIILNFTEFIPCSCGGVLEELGWVAHLYFNLFFVLLALIGSLVMANQSDKKYLKIKNTYYILGISSLLSVASVMAVYFYSKNPVIINNELVRTYKHHTAHRSKDYRLPYNSYYLAGIYDSVIYLGNSTAPLVMSNIGISLTDLKQDKLEISETGLPYRSITIQVSENRFYLADGTIPIIQEGSLNLWKANTISLGQAYFSWLVPIGNDQFLFRTRSFSTKENVLGKLQAKSLSKPILKSDILRTQLDGSFDTDGMLLYNHQLQKGIYVYYYRNEFILMDNDLEEHQHYKSIDTVSKAQLDIHYYKDQKAKELVTPPLVIHKQSATYGSYLFIQSERLGRYEDQEILKAAAIIDVYNLKEHRYDFSFYLYHPINEKPKKFIVTGNALISISENLLTTYRLDKQHFPLLELEE